jgi:hypothetical protein
MRPSHALRFWPALALAAILIIANWPLVSGRECPPFDAFAGFGTYHHLVGVFASAGRWVTWNPWSSAGSPSYADPQVGAYAPLIVLTAWLANGSEAGFRLYWLLIWYLGGLGIIVLGRHLRVPRWGCVAAATTFAFCGFYTGHAEHTDTIYAFSALPWIIWRADIAIVRGGVINAAQAGALLGLSALGGYPAMVIGNASYVTLWSLGRALTATQHRRRRWASLLRWAWMMPLMAAIVVLIAATTYAPFFVDARGYSGRTSALPRAVAVENGAFLPRALATFASPAIAPLDFGDQPDPSLRSVYLGSVIPLLALTALSRRRRHRLWRGWIAGLGLLALMCALSTIFPLRGWLYDCCFPFRFFRLPALFRAYLLFSLIVLALYGCRDLAALIRRSSRVTLLRTLALIIPIGGIALTIVLVASAMHTNFAPGGVLHAFVIWTLPMAIVLVAAPLSRRPRQTLFIGAIVMVTSVDAVWSAALSGPLLHATNDAWYRTSEVRYQGLDLTSRGLTRQVETSANANLWHQVPVLRNYTPFQNTWYERLSRHPVFERAATQPDRIFFTTEVPLVPVHERIFAAMLDRAATLHAPVVVAHEPDALLAPAERAREHDDDDAVARAEARLATLPAAEAIAVHVDRYVPEELTFTTTTPAAGWLLVTDRWARGWKVTVNGTPVTVYAGDFVFRAVQVPAGRVQVRFTYEKSHGLWLVALSWSTCGLLLLGVPLVRAGTKLTRA